MTQNVFDQASRYAAKLDPQGFLAWALTPVAIHFERWLDTRMLPFPGEPDRICDTVARLIDVADTDPPWAMPVEFMLEPEAELFGRLLAYLGLLWLEERPSQDRGARYRVGAVVINLTGVGRTSRDMRLTDTSLQTLLGVQEKNLSAEDAAATLAQIVAGSVTRCLLPFIPLMQGGGEVAIIQQWMAEASQEQDVKRRGDYGGLALVFAEAAGCSPAWKHALRGWNVVQSQQVSEWMAEGEARGEAKGVTMGRAAALIEVLEMMFGPLPTDLETTIRATGEVDRLKKWMATAISASSLADFRRDAQI